MKIIMVALLLLAGCAAPTKMTTEARMVREITIDYGENCSFLGVYDGEVFALLALVDIKRDARTIARNKTAELGGNAFMLYPISSTASAYHFQYGAYKCPI